MENKAGQLFQKYLLKVITKLFLQEQSYGYVGNKVVHTLAMQHWPHLS